MTKEERLQIANTIWHQLGGHKFELMTSAKEPLALENGLRFKLPGGGGHIKNGINLVTVTLDWSDTYTMKFERRRFNRKTLDVTCKTIAEHAGVYCDMLQDIFTKETGLYTHL